MTSRPWSTGVRRALPALGAALALAVSVIVGLPTTSQAAAQGPCDIYAAAGTPCVAAHSTVRALYSGYDGPLYQVRRSSDDGYTTVGPLTAGGVADAAAQDAFCADTSCVITRVYDQSANHNDLTIEGPGGNGGQDVGAYANALPVTVDGHKAYGVYITPGTGYRDDATKGVATGSTAQDEYMVTSGTHVDGGCCFDYGNAETNNDDNGSGHMSAINFGTECWFPPCTGSGPWVQADLENGLFAGGNGSNPGNRGNSGPFVTALVRTNGTSDYSIEGGNAQSGALTDWYDGSLPTTGGYIPMHQEGAIVLGTGGDDSNSSAGSFFEGVMTAGLPSAATDAAVQADIVAAGYTAYAGSAPAVGSRISLRATTACCTGDYLTHDDSDTKVVIAAVTSASAATTRSDATWLVEAGLADSSCVSFESANDPGQYLRHSGFELWLNTDDGSAQFAQDATFCAQPGIDGQGFSFQTVNYPGTYIRHFDYTVYVASDGGSNTWDNANLWTSDVSWAVTSPWA
ncbi:alpha-L-arabinofuranosidase B [Streptacidiphilus sp. P02-A3a]|uniref:alpha-L-arabinofuranosidase B n=1 Tax=Streptacidiphilus sp. P02-A3a TaxID=2704468 RepID=UPI0015FE3EEF|nr:alpha-L-arabinofuranosidase B [Streptacidiphilus sp. P02-A3a]QMU71236.1 alpha-N-arabinofuranosidase [Streptacidiphilus sp. P02-A3a]